MGSTVLHVTVENMCNCAHKVYNIVHISPVVSLNFCVIKVHVNVTESHNLRVCVCMRILVVLTALLQGISLTLSQARSSVPSPL